MAGSWHLAVDFGTSNSAAAHTGPFGGVVEALALSHRSNLMPSAVFVELDGSTVVSGDSALLAGRRDPSRLVLSPKRFIDHDTIQLEGDDVSTRLVFSAVIREIVDRAKSQHGGSEPASVTLTHPERWSHTALGNLVDAAQAAGIAVGSLRTISEPRAAAIHYAAQQRVAAGEHVAVFDFGGGTLDIAVLRAAENGDYRVVAARGDNSLGGRTIDNLVFRWVIDQIDHDDPDLADSLRKAPASVMNALQENIREAKEMLSDTTSATVTISSPAGERDVLITRDEFTRIISQSIGRAVEMTQAVLREAGVVGSQTPIYLTGGSSRIPFVQDELGKVGRVMRLDDPKTVVCRGALVASMRGFSKPVQPGHTPPRTTAKPQMNPFVAATAPGSTRIGVPQQPRPTRPASPAQPQGFSHGQVAQYGQQGNPSALSGASWSVQSGAPRYSYSPPPGAVPSSAQTPAKKKSNAPLLVTLGVAGVALLVGIGWWGSNGAVGGGNNFVAPTSTKTTSAKPTSTKPTSAAPTTTSRRFSPETAGSGYGYASPEEFLGNMGLPPEFLAALNGCVTDPMDDDYLLGANWLNDREIDFYMCSGDIVESSDTFYYALFIDGDSAREAYADLTKSPLAEQWSDGNPKIHFVPKRLAAFNEGVIYYPDDQFMIVLDTGYLEKGDDAARTRATLEQFGFL